MKETRLYLIRHGQVEGWDTGRINGQTDVPLTPLGRAQARAAALRIAHLPLAAIYCSDLTRSMCGAECVANGRGLVPESFPEFRELDFGRWEGRTHREVEVLEGATIDTLFQEMMLRPATGGESLTGIHRRVMGCLRSLIEKHRGESICLVAHSGVNRIVLSDALCGGPDLFWKLDQGYGCLNIINYGNPKGAIVSLMNEANSEKGQGGEVL